MISGWTRSAFGVTVFVVLQGDLSVLFSVLLQGRYSSKEPRWMNYNSELVDFFLKITPLATLSIGNSGSSPTTLNQAQ